MGDVNVKTIFCGTERSNTQDTELICHCNTFDEIFIQITDPTQDHINNCEFICLNKATAIKLHRELKKQISFIEEGGDNE